MLNYEIVEKIHTSTIWNNVILKVKVKGKEKVYILKLYAGINGGFQKLVFNREMEALKVLNACEGIVKIRDTSTSLRYNKEGNYGAILMDYVEGKTLDHYNWNQFSALRKYEICYKILQAVHNAHSNNVIHRDIKPQNIIYDDVKNEITIIDFGASKIKTIIDKATTMPMLSENYSAPEVIKGNDITEKCDYYSLGTVFYEMLLCEEATDCKTMINNIEQRIVKNELRELLISMLQENPKDRPENIEDISIVFSNLIGELNTSLYEFNVYIDNEKLRYLKRCSVVPNSMNMTQFVNSYLKKEFVEKYGYYDERNNTCIITGQNVVLECSFNEYSKSIDVVKISEVTVDRRNINLKRSFKIDGKLSFVDSQYRRRQPVAKDNAKLLVMFRNRREENEFYREKEEKFDKLFGSWEIGLEESVKSEKEKAAKIHYTKYSIEDKLIVLEVDNCETKSIDEILPNTQFVIETTDKDGLPVYYDVGVFEEIICDEDNVQMILRMPKKNLKANIRALLSRKVPILEDFRANTSAYRRQFKAIHSLRKEEYSARNLKDILLSLDEPDEIPTISQPKFIAKNLNSSQEQAVVKTLNSENIGLIQGPPGTGKTKVIKEIIGQIILHEIKTIDSPRILIVSQSHTAVDNILEGLDAIIPDDSKIIRIGADKNISDKIVNRYTVSAQRDILFENITKDVLLYRDKKEKLMNGLENEEELKRWERIKEIQKEWLERSVEKDCLDYQLIRSATIIAGTCIGFLANSVIRDMEFDYVIIDEAAKATTPELLVSIIKAKKIILVGDQNQLPAYADERVSPTISKLTKNPEYRIFDILFENLPEQHKQVLTTQYRMISNIGNLISTVFYGGTIDTGCNDNEKQHNLTRYEGKSIIWFDTSKNANKAQKRTKGGSFINEEEKRIIMEIFEDLKNNDELTNLDIGVITGYSGQKDLLRKAVKAGEYDKVAQIDINTLDAFQGRENDIIIYSTVRTKDSIGFQKEKERVNVAFSRAKKLLIICGDLEFFYNYDDPNNKFIEIIDYLKEHNQQCSIISCKGGNLF